MQRSTAGFDWLRLSLALSVILYHSLALTSDNPGALRDHGWYCILAGMGVPGFFAVSGFLVSASAERHATAVFAAYRALRLLPALFVVLALGVLVVGPIVTTLPLADYFATPKTWAQFGILIGYTQTQAPGFQGKNIADFNGSLWSIPWEMACYVGLALLARGGALRKPWMIGSVAAFMGLFTVLVPVVSLFKFSEITFPGLFAYFAMGSVLYVLRERIPTSLPLGLTALAAAALLFGAGLAALTTIPLAYGIIVIGLQPAKRLPEDWSYGVYIAAFPAQQILSLTAFGAIWWVNAILTAAWALGFGALSWRFIESPALALKPKARAWLQRETRKSHDRAAA